MYLLSPDQLCQSAVFTDRVVCNQPRSHYIYLLTYFTFAYFYIISFIIDLCFVVFIVFFKYFFFVSFSLLIYIFIYFSYYTLSAY